MNYFSSHQPPRQKGRESSLDNLSIVIGDGQEFFAHQLRRSLTQLGTGEIHTAKDGLEAIALVRMYTPNLAIVDWTMEETSGLDFVRFMRLAEDSPAPALPILMTMSTADRQRIAAARDAGVDEVLVKPVAVETLLKRIIWVLRRPRPFVTVASYTGPDRRRHHGPFGGTERRQAI